MGFRAAGGRGPPEAAGNWSRVADRAHAEIWRPSSRRRSCSPTEGHFFERRRGRTRLISAQVRGRHGRCSGHARHMLRNLYEFVAKPSHPSVLTHCGHTIVVRKRRCLPVSRRPAGGKMTPSTSRYASRVKPARVSDGAAPLPPARVWSSADVEADILSEACRPGVGEPVTIHIRPAVYARMLAERRPAGRQEGLPREATRVPFVIDDGIPSAPGYEIHRAVPQGWPCAT
jgi:hypothetical protein